MKKNAICLIILNFFILPIDSKEFKNSYPFLMIQSEIISARVFLNGSYVGNTDERGDFVIPLSDGKYQLEIKSFTYKTINREISLQNLSNRLVFKPQKKFVFTYQFVLLFLTLLFLGLLLRKYYHKKSPKIFGKYKLKNEVGKGGIATIYKAYDRKIKKELVLKIMDKKYIRDRDMVEKFIREGKVLSIIKKKYPDAAVVRAYEYGRMPERNNIPYVAVEYLPGKSLLEIIKEEGKISEPKALHFVRLIVLALKDCHNSGIYHRDLSPDNVIVNNDRNQVTLIDFGIAKNEFTSYKTLDGSIAGKPIYMSPEQCRGERVTAATDIYTLGVLLFLLIQGDPPFKGSNPLEIMNKHQNAKFPGINQQVNKETEELIKNMMQKEAVSRSTLEEVLLTINKLIDEKKPFVDKKIKNLEER